MAKDGNFTSATEATYATLRRELLACRIPPGERLKISELATGLTVSAGAVREALARLTADGLVVAEPHRGFRASPVSLTDLRDLTMVRKGVEAECLRRSILEGDLRWESDLIAAHHRLARTPRASPGNLPQDEWQIAHADYHEALVAGCDGDWLRQTRRHFHAQSERYGRRISFPAIEGDRDVAAEHRLIMEAALARDAEAAVALLEAHIDTTLNIVMQYLQATPIGEGTR